MPLLISTLRTQRKGELTPTVVAGFSSLLFSSADRAHNLFNMTALGALPEAHEMGREK